MVHPMPLSGSAAAALADRAEARAFEDLYAAAPAPLRDRLGLRTGRVGGATLLVAPGLPTPMFNRAIGLGVEAPARDADVDAVVAAYAAAGVRGWWLHLSPWAAPADLGARLRARGFAAPERASWAKLLRATASPPAPAGDLAAAACTAADALPAAQAIASAFGMPPFMADWLGALAGRARWRLYGLTAPDGAVAGGACLFVDDGVGWLGMGAVLPAWRRRGGQRALLARRVADAGAAGAAWAVSETGEPAGDEANPSLANLRRAGFETVASRLNLVAPA